MDRGIALNALLVILLFLALWVAAALVSAAYWRRRCLGAERLLWDYDPAEMAKIFGSMASWRAVYNVRREEEIHAQTRRDHTRF